MKRITAVASAHFTLALRFACQDDRTHSLLMSAKKSKSIVRSYYVLPCCLLLLNLCVEMVSYKARAFHDPLARTAAIMAMVLFGGSFVGFVAAPAITTVVATLHQGSRDAGKLIEILFFTILGAGIFWLYYRVYILGADSVLPTSWHN